MAMLLAAGVVTSLPGQVTLNPGDTATLPDVSLSSPGLVAQLISDSLAVANAVAPEDDFQFTLTSTVMTSVSNPFGADRLVFAYQLTNTAAPNGLLGLTDPGIGRLLEWGITELWINSFTGYSVAVGEDVPAVAPFGVVPGPVR
ncbi:MAG: hypothetical protein HZC55_17965, partial [Verrucomicrobia bacterium]|nr:hypothetical protein [Verrucomicrobiota bacterium]